MNTLASQLEISPPQGQAGLPAKELVSSFCGDGLVTGEMIQNITAWGWVRNAEWFETLVMETKGFPEVYRATLDRGGSTPYSFYGQSAAEAYTKVIAPHMNGDERLWMRLLSAEPGSPMADPTLSLKEAIGKYQERWAEAERRLSAKA